MFALIDSICRNKILKYQMVDKKRILIVEGNTRGRKQ